MMGSQDHFSKHPCGCRIMGPLRRPSTCYNLWKKKKKTTTTSALDLKTKNSVSSIFFKKFFFDSGCGFHANKLTDT